MLAAELARLYPTVSLDTGALEAARILADRRLPGLSTEAVYGVSCEATRGAGGER